MTTTRRTPMLVLAVALTALVATVGYALANATDTGWGTDQMQHGTYAMMDSNGKSTAWFTGGNGPIRDIAAARAQAQRFADRLDLTTAEVMQFSKNFYAVLDDNTGHGATEVLVDPQTGAVTLEYGPAMMWNSRYGMMGGTTQGGMMGSTTQGGMMGTQGGMMGTQGGMMGTQGGMMGGTTQGGMMGTQGGMMGGTTQGGMMGSTTQGGMMGTQGGMMGSAGRMPTWTPSNVKVPVSAAQAQQLADRWLSLERPGAKAAEPEQLPGYYTMDTSRDGKVEGMLSVNRATGALWYHWWHGRFVAMET